MAKGRSLHIGLNSVDKSHYQGWSGELLACENDARDMESIAKSQGYASKLLLTSDATRKRVLDEISQSAQALTSGDMFLLSNSSHGGQLPDQNGDEDDGMDETWCLYDSELVDDEIFAALSQFGQGVRILVFSDSCHSGTVTKEAVLSVPRGLASQTASEEVRYRAMPNAVAARTYLHNKSFYDAILSQQGLAKAAQSVKASVLLISGCQDNQLSADGPFNGRFTQELKTVWNGGKFSSGYAAFHAAIVKRMPRDQTPNLFRIGVPNSAFESQRVFSLNSAGGAV